MIELLSRVEDRRALAKRMTVSEHDDVDQLLSVLFDCVSAALMYRMKLQREQLHDTRLDLALRHFGIEPHMTMEEATRTTEIQRLRTYADSHFGKVL